MRETHKALGRLRDERRLFVVVATIRFAGKEPSTCLLLPAGRGKVPDTSLSPITTFHTVRKDPSTSLLLTAGRSKELSTSFHAVEQESHA